MKKQVLIVLALVLIAALGVSVSPVTAIANGYAEVIQSRPNALTDDVNALRHNNLPNSSAQNNEEGSEIIRPLTQSHTENFSRDYTLTGNGATDIIAVAFAQLGKTGSQLGYTEQWCADFIGDCAILAGQSAAVPLNGLVSTFRQQLIAAGGFYSTSDPQPGDICVIDWDGTHGNDHVEIVYAVSGTTISTIGGNTGGGSSLYTRRVATHAPLNSGYITCIIRPNYSWSITTPPEAPQNVHTDKNLYSCNEYITFYWDASVGATNYHVYMWKDGVQLYLQDVGTNLSFTSAPTSAGNYRLIVRAGNSFGYSDGPAYVDFTVYDSIPEAPTVTTDKQYYRYGEPIIVSWNYVTNTEFYWFEIYNESGELLIDERFDDTTITSYAVNNLPAGTYKAYVFPNNDFGFSTGECSFAVYDSIPEAPTVTTDKQYYRYGEPIVVSWTDVANTEFYWFEIYTESGELLIDERFDDTTINSYAVNNLPAGTYRAYVFPNNAFGFSTGECSFAVYDSIPEAPTVTTDKQYYRYGEPIVVSWNDVANTEFYWFEIYTESGELLIDERFDITTTSYVVNNLPIGSYVVYVFPNNAFGYSIGECRFSVSNQQLGDADNDGELSAVDAMMLLRHALGIVTLENTEWLDVNSDGLVNILDALVVLRIALGVLE